ncbi:hypothetical protein [Paenibacillus sp. DMB20]|uniref:hypothetical protein n=1 Tax=Paenibacillus sp. DMB20 TaxID=1642570 RepID=UPI0006276A7B|nr:hypothetical protein [Paenibacillus sp. DMB20]KKO51157.1 hypothetical protein XI25_29665 [Paenibacillus sp. DMB20]
MITVKKLVAGFILGAFIMMSAQAFGDGISFIGKKVDGQTTVTINGEEIGEAVIINGKSFAPVREITEGFGGKVEQASGKGIALKMDDVSVSTTDNPNTDNTSTDNTKLKSELEQKIDQQKKQIKSINEVIAGLEEQLVPLKEKADADKTTVGVDRTKYEIFKNVLQERKDSLPIEEKKLADLEAQLAALQSPSN